MLRTQPRKPDAQMQMGRRASPLVQRLPKAAEKQEQLLLLQTINSGRVSAMKTDLGGGGGGVCSKPV